MIYITGFFNVGNIGDEAMSLVLSTALRDFDPVVTAGVFNRGKPKAIIVGGGEYENWMVKDCRWSDVPIYAISIGLMRDGIGEERKKYLKTFKRIWVRTLKSYFLAGKWGLNTVWSGDTVCLLEPTVKAGQFVGKRIICPSHKVSIHEALDYNSVIIPFHPYDMDGINIDYPVYRSEDPVEMLNAFVGAKEVVTWGRLHPQVFAWNVGIECIDLKPNVKTRAFQEQVQLTSSYVKRLVTNHIQDLRNQLNNL